MAAEIIANVSLTITKNGFTVTGSKAASKDMTGTEMQAGTQSTSTTTAQINVGGCDQIESILIINQDATNSVQIGLNTPLTQRCATIKPGSFIFLDSPPALLYALASAGTPDIWVVVCES